MSKKLILIIGIIILGVFYFVFQTTEGAKQPTKAETKEKTGIVSGRILSDNFLLEPVYDASVLVNGKAAEIYGTTYLALKVSVGEVTVEAHDSKGQTMKKTITVEPSIVNSVDLIFPGGEEGTPPEVTSTSDHLQFRWENGMSVELNLKGDELLGIGEVKVNKIPLREPLLTGTPTIEKIKNGRFVEFGYEKCQYISSETKGKIAIVHSKLVSGQGDIDLDWIFTPWEMTVEGTPYEGLGYRFSILSPVDISKMGFNCSWELNGNISGKTLLTRRVRTEWERDCTQSEGFEIKTHSLISQSQPPDYQYDDSGVLASFIWPLGEVENTLQKDVGSGQLWFYDKFSFGETRQAQTPLRVVLYTSKGGLDEYTYLFDQINENYRKFYGQEEVALLPTVLASKYLSEGVRLRPGIAPLYRKVADNWLSEFADHNFKQLLIIDVWESNGRIGAPYDGNRLATHDIKIHPDDVDELKYFVNKTHDLDMKFMVWLSTCYSQESPLYDTNNWKVQNVDGRYPSAASGDVYLMSYRSGYLAYALEKLKAVKEEFKFDGIWHDSFGAGFHIDYSDTHIESPIDQQLQFLSATQRMGYSNYLESLGPLAMTGVGFVFVTPQGAPRGNRDMNAAFGGREYLVYKTSFVLWHPQDYHPMQIDYYKFLANKAVPMIDPLLLDETEKDNVSRANKDYNAVSSYMDKRHVLSHDKGVLWYDKESNTQVLFAYKEFSYLLERNINKVFDITSNSVVEIKSGSFTTQPKHTYKLH